MSSYQYANTYGSNKSDELLTIEAKMRIANALERIADALDIVANREKKSDETNEGDD